MRACEQVPACVQQGLIGHAFRVCIQKNETFLYPDWELVKIMKASFQFVINR